MPTVLVIDDDRTILHIVTQGLADTETNVVSATTAADGLAAIEREQPDVVLLDIVLPETSGLELFEQIHAADAKLPVIFITAGGASNTAIEAMKLGAFDYLLKPLDLDRVRALVDQAVKIRRLMHVPVGMPATQDARASGDQLVGRSPQMQEVYKGVGRVASQDVTVLILGESGTGKELVARALYQHSRRVKGPFLAVNCAALTESLLESELFGHEKGAFTGADQKRIGKFEQCNGGTIFLDEIGDMTPLVQSKVLRILQQQQFERVGGNQTIETDVRIIAATNRDLETMVEKGDFREDLFYRLNGFTINLPPLRDRGGDILLLLEHFLADFTEKLERDVHSISPEALNVLMHYDWPGNVRELQSVLKQSLLQATGPVVIPEFLPKSVLASRQDENDPDGDLPPHDLRAFLDRELDETSRDVHAATVEMMERYLLTRVLRLTEGNQSTASRVLGITRGSLRNKLRALDISIDQVVSVASPHDGRATKSSHESPV